MRQNEFVAISTDRVLLVPYDRHHVLTYHAWMEDPAIQQATASERLTLEEEYENQESWRASRDKMTFIVCRPLPLSLSRQSLASSNEKGRAVQAGVVDTPDRMIGDINLFLSPYDGDDEDDDDSTSTSTGKGGHCIGEVDIMIANHRDQGKGTGKAAVLAFLGYLARHVGEILGEYTGSLDSEPTLQKPPKLHSLMAKINQTNERSIALFKSLGFEQEGEVNFFGEVKLVLTEKEFARMFGAAVGGDSISITPGYEEMVYVRTGEGEE